MDHAAALALIGPFEGKFEHMYLDTVGCVTVGIGNMLPNAEAACALTFVRRDTDARASRAEITQDYQRVFAAVKGRFAHKYKPLTTVDLMEPEIERLFGRRVDEFVGQLGKHYPDFGTYPDPVQLAMLDMSFNLGVGALVHRWPNLNHAIEKRDWGSAAEHSHRPESHDRRNEAIRALFLSAA